MLFMILPCGFVQADALKLGVLPMKVLIIAFMCDVVGFFRDC